MKTSELIDQLQKGQQPEMPGWPLVDREIEVNIVELMSTPGFARIVGVEFDSITTATKILVGP
jgi:hypothetical protein